MVNDEDTFPEYGKAKEKMFVAETPATKELFLKLDEKTRMIEALTKVTANQHDEIIHCRDRINELLRSNNAFEARARNAERQRKAPAELAKLTEAGQELYCAITGSELADSITPGSGMAEAIREYVEASNAYFDRLSKPA